MSGLTVDLGDIVFDRIVSLGDYRFPLATRRVMLVTIDLHYFGGNLLSCEMVTVYAPFIIFF